MQIVSVFIYVLILINSVTATPNIVLILADDLGYDDLSYRGSNEFYTPNIDAIGFHGKILKHLYTAPLCTPSRSCLLTGKFPIRTGLQHYVISNEESTALPLNITVLPEVLSDNGYSTHLIGKWHLGMAKKENTPTYRGFDHHFGSWGSYLDYYTRTCKIQGDDRTYGYDFRRDMFINCENPGRYLTDLYADEAERIILANNGTKPLFLMIAHAAPHTANPENPLQAPVKTIKKFSYIKDEARRKYAAMVYKLDESVGRVVSALDKANMLSNSIIIFSSDNGGPSIGHLANSASNWPFKGQKNTPWEGGVHAGGVVWSSAFKGHSGIFEQPMHLIDWLPTLATAAGIQLNTDLALDGIDLWQQLLVNSSEIVTRDILHYLDESINVMSLTRGAWKYIKGNTENGLYDAVLRLRETEDVTTKNYTKEILSSSASKSLQKYDAKRLTAQRINELRVEAGVKCKSEVRRSCNPVLEECLYNIAEDPCEENNLRYLREYEEHLNDLRQRVQVYKNSAMKLSEPEDTTLNDPAYHNCQWSNFGEEPAAQQPVTCNKNAHTLYCPVHI